MLLQLLCAASARGTAAVMMFLGVRQAHPWWGGAEVAVVDPTIALTVTQEEIDGAVTTVNRLDVLVRCTSSAVGARWLLPSDRSCCAAPATPTHAHIRC